MRNAKTVTVAGVILAILALPRPGAVSSRESSSGLSSTDAHLSLATTDLPPNITAHADSASQLLRLAEGLLVFVETGMRLPPLEVSFFDSPGSCRDAKGLFDPNPTPWRISICNTEITSVVEHELAHAWIAANVGGHERSEFIELRGLENWADQDVPWNERGTEWAAVVVQQGLNGLPLPPVLSYEAKSRLQSFELLTGRVAPVLIDWITKHDVSCTDRPTDLSRPIADASGRSCALSRPVIYNAAISGATR
jgi:hypothetical protein